ncbi:MAG TPA: serine hydrolase [Stellaceae bacterium]|nr:serine hydrolase [Stellaceae bacterium]
MRKSALLAAGAAVLAAGCAAIRVDRPVRVASGLTSHVLCSETFVAGLDPARVYAERIKPLPGIGTVDWALRYDVDAAHRAVTTTIAGAFESRAVYRDGLGCLLVHGDEPADAPSPQELAKAPQTPPLLPDIAGSTVVAPHDKRLQLALERAFADPDRPPYHRVKAVVVVHDGRVVAERYAPGYGIDTPLLSFSAAKSVTSALVGILVREGRLSLDQPAALPAWRGPTDPRRAITIDELLRQTSGIDLAETNSGFDPSTRMQFIERDMAGFAESVPLRSKPGAEWAYTDGNYILLSRVIRDAVGGHTIDVLRFAQRELFDPLGMRHVTMEFDATGTPVGATFMLMPARDWARFGLLYLTDGVVGGRRVLPEGWVRYSSSRTLDTGYGAGFWTNLADGNVPAWGVPWGMPHAPRDAFFARGFMGQYVVVIPSRNLVITRFGDSAIAGDDIQSMDRLVADIVATIDAADANQARRTN